MNRRLIPALTVVAALGLVACGDDGDDAADTTLAAAAPTTAAESETSATMAESADTMAGSEDTMAGSDDTMAESGDTMAEAAEGNIVEVAQSAGDFTTLVAAVEAAGLAETLSEPGPFTVFAPTDEAFAALPAGTVDQLLEDPTGPLADILTYHVVPGEVLAADVATLAGQEVTTVNGATFTVNVDGATVSLTDAAGNTVNVVTTDIPASNGVIHVIDGVLMPS
jgi:uncharacterized surface protein with fasciclin (FAS1) repeats